MEELVGRKEAGRSSALHECDWEVATNAVTSQHDPRMWRVDGQPLLPGVGWPTMVQSFAWRSIITNDSLLLMT